MPIEKLHISSAGGIGLTDEARESPSSADFARNCNFAVGAYMIESERAPAIQVDLGVGNVLAAGPLPGGELVAVMDSIVLGGTTYANAPVRISDGTVSTISKTGTLVSTQPYDLFPGHALIMRELRLPGRPVLWTDGQTYQHAALLRPVVYEDSNMPFYVVSRILNGELVALTYTQILQTKRYELEATFRLSPFTQEERDLLETLIGQRVILEVRQETTIDIIPSVYKLESVWPISSSQLDVTLKALNEYILSTPPTNWTGSAPASLKLGIVSLKDDVGDVNARVFYAFSFAYKGGQEGPLSDPISVVVDSDTSQVKVTLAGPVQLEDPRTGDAKALSEDGRIEGMHIYRAYGHSVQATKPDTTYSYVGYLPLSTINQSGTITFTDDLGVIRESYEERTGVLETIASMMLDAQLVATDGTYVFYGNVEVHEKGQKIDLSMSVVRSKPMRPDMVDWVRDQVTLPEPPTAMQVVGGRLLVWTRQHLYVYTRNLELIEVLQGMGAPHQQATAAWEQGAAWANSQGLWVYDGANAVNLGAYLHSSASLATSSGFEQRSDYRIEKMTEFRVGYMPRYGAIVYYGGQYQEGTSEQLWGWVYYIAQRQLVLVRHTTIDGTLPEHLMLLDRGLVGFVRQDSSGLSTTKLARFGEGSSYEPYLWRSVDLARGERVRIYEIYTQFAGDDSVPTLTVCYGDTDGIIKRFYPTPHITGDMIRWELSSPLESRRIFIEISGNGAMESMMIRLRRLGR